MRRILIFFLITGWFALIFPNTRILMIGNSITDGVRSSNGLGFRDDLYNQLLTTGYPFAFVGSQGDPPYQGHFLPGTNIGQFYEGPGGDNTFSVQPDMDTYKPHVVVIHLGTNDTYLGIDMAPYTTDGGATFTTNIAGRLAHLITYLLQWYDGTRGDHLETIFVSQIIPNLKNPDEVNAFNPEVSQLIEDANNGLLASIPPGILKCVDQNSSFEIATMLDGDQVHPNDVGYVHMANVYRDALKTMPMRLLVISDPQPRGVYNHLLPYPISVRVVDGFGDGVEGVDVQFEVVAGDAALVGLSIVSTDSTGNAEIDVQLGGLGQSLITAYSEHLIDSVAVFDVVAAEGVRVEGMVTYYQSETPIPNVGVEWRESRSFVDTTDTNGQFGFENFPYGDDVTLRFAKERWSDVSASPILSYDAALTARQAVGLENLSEASRKAADVDRDGRITMNDAAHIARHAVGYPIIEDIYVGDWAFIPDSTRYDSLTSDLNDQEFTGILVGDVHGGWQPAPLVKNHEKRDTDVLNGFRSQGEGLMSIPIQLTHENMLSCDMTLRYDPGILELVAIEKARIINDFELLVHERESGNVRIGLYGIEEKDIEGPVIYAQFISVGNGIATRLELDPIFINDERFTGAGMEMETGRLSHLPDEMILFQNYPNPFNAETVIDYRITTQSHVRVVIYNTLGQEVITLRDERQPAGIHRIRWEGLDNKGMPVPSGVYFYMLNVNGERIVRKMEMVR